MALNHKIMLVFVAVASLQASPVRAYESQLEIFQTGGITYVSGGIGQEESDEMEASQQNYNLRVTNADRTGHFSGDTRIVISDMKNHPLLDTSVGPLFYADLPNGRYIVEGFNEVQSKKQTIHIVGRAPVRIHFIWEHNSAQNTNY